VQCGYCGEEAKLVRGQTIYPYRPDLYFKNFYLCDPCEAWVGCHPGTDRPLGRLANTELRKSKRSVHFLLDDIWRGQVEKGVPRGKARSRAYKKLANLMNIPEEQCHVGMFDIDHCNRAIEILKEWKE
jgi:hypothetical protein